MKKWKTIFKGQKFNIGEIANILLENRGIKTKKEIDEFLNPKLEQVTVQSAGIDTTQLKKAVSRIQKAINKDEAIVIYGDYDVDGICGTAILWETIYKGYKNVFPYIPHRVEEGYGLSVKGIENLLANKKVGPLSNSNHALRSDLRKTKLIITVDNGIVANEAVEFANAQGIDVIITDHHVPSKLLPPAYAIIHTTKLCGAGVAYLLSEEIKNKQSLGSKDPQKSRSGPEALQDRMAKIKNEEENSHLELVALATVADLVPLVGSNRTLLAFGMEKLRKTSRVGLAALFSESGIDATAIGVYEIGHIIAPRLNAAGRLEYAMDSLRLLCTKDKNRATLLAHQLGRINRERQQLTEETVAHAREKLKSSTSAKATADKQNSKIGKLLFISHESYQQGVIGLVAGKLVEEYYRPSIVVSVGETYSKASARSIAGFNIIEFIRSSSQYLVDAGGHPMAAGFTVETAKLEILKKTFEDMAERMLDETVLTRTLRIDCELPLSSVSGDLYRKIQSLAPFGMGNPEPTFLSRNVIIEDMRIVGNDGKHLKLKVKSQPFGFAQGEKLKVKSFDAIAFGMGERVDEFRVGDIVDIVYVVDQNTWNGDRTLQLKVKDFRKSDMK